LIGSADDAHAQRLMSDLGLDFFNEV